MTTRVQVCGAPTAIALDVERDETRSKYGCILRTADDNMVLKNAENSLRVADAQKFCAGVLDIRHVVELPPNVTFNERNWIGKFGVAWKNSKQDCGEVAVYVVDFESGEVAARVLPSLSEQIADVFVDAKGDRVAVVGATTGILYAFSQRGWKCNEMSETTSQPDWRTVDGTATVTMGIGTCSCGQFVSSAVMGNCFVYLRARGDSNASLVVEKWIFDVDSHWALISFSSRVLGASNSVDELALFMTSNWKFAMLTSANSLYHLHIDQNLRNSPVKRLTLDHRILDGAWIDQDTAFAALLENGQISIASVSAVGCFECLAIVSTSTMSKRLSISALLGKAVSAALQLMWVEQEKQLVVDFGATCAAFKLEIIADESSSNNADGPNKWTELSTTGAFAKRNREGITGLNKRSTDFGECIRELLEGKTHPSSDDLLDSAKIALGRSQNVFEDSYFTLLCNIHQQLAGDSVNSSNSRDPIDCIGKSLKLMEMLVSLTISMEAPLVRQISSRLLSSYGTKSDRKQHYLKESQEISLQVRKVLNRVSEREDWSVRSKEVAAFLRVYTQATLSILHEIHSRGKLTPGKVFQISSLCQRIIEYEDGSSIAGVISKAERIDDPLMERLRGFITSYTLACYYLGVNGVMIDLEHVFSLTLSNFLKRKEMLCCFLKPWLRRIDDPRPMAPKRKAVINQVVRFAAESNTLHLLVNFCVESGSPIAHLCVQELCKAAEIHGKPVESKALSDNTLNLHWQASESYIGEAMAILRRIGARRQFKYSNREAECVVQRVSVGIGDEFEDYHQSLFTELTTLPAKNHVSKENLLWEFSHLDKRLRARVIFLMLQIVWHLEAASENAGSLFQRAFVMNLFASQLESNSQEKEMLRDYITEVRTIINPVERELRLPRFPSEDVHSGLSLREQKISRSLALIAWALWLREKVGYCNRGAHTLDIQTETNETETLGALAATCALHLNSMRMLFGDNEELHSRQLSLLEAAASMNPTKTATVIAWGFPAQKIPTRHLKRYKGLRQVVQQSCMDLSLEEKEMHYQQVRTRMRRAFQGILQSEKLTQNDSDDIDILVNCCCDQEFLQIMSVLAKCPYEVVAVSNDNPPHESSTSTSEPREDSHENDQNVLPVHTKSEETLNRTTDQVQISESSISRDEVMALLQAQTRHLEDRIHAVTSTGRSSSASSHEVVQPEEVIRDVKGLPSELLPHTLDVTSKSAGDLADVQKMARISLQVRDMSRHRYSSASSDASKQAKPVCKPTQRHDSVRNALKLFRLRQENSGHTTGETEGSAAANENGTPNIGNGDSTKTSRDIECPAASPKPNRQKRDGVKRKPSKNQRSSETQRFLAKEPVYPLRLEYGIEKASLKLLGRNAQQRNPSVKRRQFVHQEHQRTPKTYTPNPKALHDSVESTEVIQLKTASAQTSDSIVPTSAAKEMNESVSTQQNDSGPEKGSPMTQECETAPVNVKSSQNGVGIQCRLNETGPTKDGRRKQSPPPLNIVDKYPVWVDLNGGAHFKEKKYLQVARFGNSNAVDATVTEDTTMPVSVPTVVVRNVNSEDGSDENQSDGQRSPSVSSDQGQENDAAEQLGDTMRTRYRARYRELYPVRERLESTASVERERTSGINSLIDLRDNMQRMTQRLRVLETCANSIDEEFKVSQKRLSRIGDIVSDGTSPRARVLEDIDEVLEMTEDSGHQEGENKPGRSLLSKKASSDMEAAKKLLETIEQLTTSKDGK